jgi:RHS repeat-associated protein
MKKFILAIVFLYANFIALSQGSKIVLPPSGTVNPCVINPDHIKITGRTLTNIGQTFTYNVDFFYPNETGKPIQWLIFGGQIIAQNNDPLSGPLFVTVLWNNSVFDWSLVPDCIKNIPHLAAQLPVLPLPVIGVVALTQGNVLTNSIYQADAIPVMKLPTTKITCLQYPTTQQVNYGQLPCLISSVPNCIPPITAPHTYQWYSATVPSVWNPISGATQAHYQPPAFTQTTCYSRETQASGVTNFDNVGSCVDRYAFNAGQLYTDNLVVNLGDQPVIVDEMPFGGPCISSNYQHFWWVSYNDKPWVLFGTTLHFPTITGGINKESVRIKRSTICNGVELFTNILEFSYGTSLTYTKENQNYIRENTILIKNIASWAESEVLPTGEKIQATTYYDGLARPMQEMIKEIGTPDPANLIWRDIVTPIQYDALGLQTKSHLPYTTTADIGQFKQNGFTEQANYYTSNYNETPAYTQKTLELSPLNRPITTKEPGTVWAASNGNQFEYDMNDIGEKVKIWNIGFLSTDLPYITGEYATNELLKTVHIDEQLNKVIEYVDKTGNLILKKVQIAATPSVEHAGWLCTYNVYDDLGKLRYTITPKAVEYMVVNSWPTAIPTTIAKELCFGYFYDSKGRLVEKNTPQAGTVRFVYDKRDRIVLTQDENQNKASIKKWAFVLYDELNRNIVTGLMDNALTRDVLQTQVDAIAMTNSTVTVSLAAAHTEQVQVYAPVNSLGTNMQYNSITYYDNYTYTGVKTFSTAHKIPASADPNVDAIVASKRVLGMPTGTKIRVLDNTNKYLINTTYYDEQARVLQTHAENIKAGTDIVTNQYDFADKVLYSSTIHTASGSLYTNFEILTQNTYDIIGRISFLRKNYNQSVLHFKDIAEYSYDDLGRLKVKKLGPNPISGGNQVESLEYSYNLNGQLTGINKFYAVKEPGRYNKWDNFFGLYLGYDNRDNAFAKAALNGNITGAIWCTQGDDRQRKFDYDYDAANQFVKASFLQKDNTSSAWLNTNFNFSVGSNHSSGAIQYDANGNILQMTQMGVLPNKSPFVMDDLRYTYANNSYSNKLTRVDDVSGNTSNGALQDFKDGTTAIGTGFDYDYDDNGNLVLDKNKGLQNGTGNGIKYNFLDKVEEITIAGKGTVKYIYDANGEKLQKIFTPITVTPTNPIRTTTFIDAFVYSDNELQYIHTEEGRLRVITAVNNFPVKFLAGTVALPSPGGAVQKYGVLDYFVTDHLGNTRIILTDELQSAQGLCTAEMVNQSIEERQFGAVDAITGAPTNTNELFITRTSTPAQWTTNSTQKCVGLKNYMDAGGKKYGIGPNVILKVMAGDVVEGYADYYYPTGITPNNSTSLFSFLFTSVANSINANGVSANVKAAGIIPTNNAWGTANLNPILTNQPNYGSSTAPRAYLNILYFDEQFNMVGFATPQRVGTNNMDYVQSVGEKCPVNGYAYIYLSNETDNMYVYFDNFKVTHVRGRIVEENHYYPFGLKIAAICSNKQGDAENGHLQNRFAYQGSFAEEEEYTSWNEFDLRNYDAQVGRWTGVDPYDEFNSGYVGMGNDPINLTDPSGGSIFSDVSLGGMVAIGATAGFIIGGVYDMVKNDGDMKYAFYGAGIGAAAMFITSSPLNVNIQYLPTWDQVRGDIIGKGTGASKHGLASAYLAGYLRGIINEIISLGKIVTIRGDGFQAGSAYENSRGQNLTTKGTLTTKTLRYFKNHPRATRIANAYTEYHSRWMGYCKNNGANNFTDPDLIKLFDANSVFLFGNCFNASNAASTSAKLNGATVIGSFTWQLDLPFLIIGRFSGNPEFANQGIVTQSVSNASDLDGEFLLHTVANVSGSSDIRIMTKISFSGRITYTVISDTKAVKMNNVYFKQLRKTKSGGFRLRIFKAILSLIFRRW